jgi:hypothetical protein
MSKSDPSDISRINMSDNEELIRKKIRKAKTDDAPCISYNPIDRPEISNLIDIYSCFTEIDVNKVVKNFELMKNSEFKEALADVIIKKICPIHQKTIQIMEDKEYLEEITKNGTNFYFFAIKNSFQLNHSIKKIRKFCLNRVLYFILCNEMAAPLQAPRPDLNPFNPILTINSYQHPARAAGLRQIAHGDAHFGDAANVHDASLHHAARTQARDVVLRETQFLQDFIRVLAKHWRAAAKLAGRFRQIDRRGRDRRSGREARIVHVVQKSGGADVFVFQRLLRRIQRGGRNGHALEFGQRLRRGARAGPCVHTG